MALTRQKIFKLLFGISVCWNLGFLVLNQLSQLKVKEIRDFQLEYCKHFGAGRADSNGETVNTIQTNVDPNRIEASANGSISTNICPTWGNALGNMLAFIFLSCCLYCGSWSLCVCEKIATVKPALNS